jgi:uncharacterized protein (DUF58 family)
MSPTGATPGDTGATRRAAAPTVSARPTTADTGSWGLAPTYLACLVAGLVLLGIGVLARRPDLAVLGMPLLLMVAWSWMRPPEAEPSALLVPDRQVPGSGRLSAQVEIDPGKSEPSTCLVNFRVGAPGHRPIECLVPASPRTLRVAMRTVRTGRREVFWIEHRAAGPDRLWVVPPEDRESLTITVLPTTHPLALAPLPFRLAGLTGQHGSRRTGDGGDLHDIAPFRPGDRLRRIDWPVTARLNTGGPPVRYASDGANTTRLQPTVTTLYVRRTFATADATVMLVVDSRDEVGPRVATWNDSTALGQREASSLDIARVAASSMARHYLNVGDRVGLEDLGRLRRPVPPAGGQRQLDRLVRRLALAQPAGEPTARKRVPRLPSGALIVVFSTLLDDDPATLAIHWRRNGHRVVVVDVLPPVSTAELGHRLMTAYRIITLERNDRIRQLQANDVELVSWPAAGGAAEPQAALTVLARQRERRRSVSR